MNRKLIIEAIVKIQMGTLRSNLPTILAYLSDTNLVALAIDLGIDTDTLLCPDLGKCGHETHGRWQRRAS